MAIYKQALLVYLAYEKKKKKFILKKKRKKLIKKKLNIHKQIHLQAQARTYTHTHTQTQSCNSIKENKYQSTDKVIFLCILYPMGNANIPNSTNNTEER